MIKLLKKAEQRQLVTGIHDEATSIDESLQVDPAEIINVVSSFQQGPIADGGYMSHYELRKHFVLKNKYSFLTPLQSPSFN